MHAGIRRPTSAARSRDSCQPPLKHRSGMGRLCDARIPNRTKNDQTLELRYRRFLVRRGFITNYFYLAL